MNFKLLHQAVSHATLLGLTCYVETNASWCVNEDIAGRQFERLSNAGLKAVLISCSPFHAVTIPLERTLLAIRKAIEVFGFNGVMVYLPEWIEIMKPMDKTKPISLEDFYSHYSRAEAGGLFWEGYGLISGGRCGYQLGDFIRRQPPESFTGITCLSELLFSPHSHFDLFGNFIPGFCGGLSIGSWQNLRQTVVNFIKGEYPELIGILIAKGPFGLYEYACQGHQYIPLEMGYAGKCHLCVDIRRTLVSRGIFPELSPEEFYRRI